MVELCLVIIVIRTFSPFPLRIPGHGEDMMRTKETFCKESNSRPPHSFLVVCEVTVLYNNNNCTVLYCIIIVYSGDEDECEVINYILV